MLCATCHGQLEAATVCATCGTPAPGVPAPLELVLGDGTRVPVLGDLTIGRAPGNSLCLDDPSVSRLHARVRVDGGTALLEDAGSSYGTFIDGVAVGGAVPLRGGTEIGVGDLRIGVERQDDPNAGAGRTLVVPVGASLVLGAAGPSLAQTATRVGERPRLRSGYALKRLDESEGDRRWVVRDLRSGDFLRLGERDAELLGLLDGSRSLADLIGEAEQRLGPAGIPGLIRLLTDLGERGMLAGVEGRDAAAPHPTGWRRVFRTRELAFGGLGRLFGALYRGGGWLLFTRPFVAFVCALSVAGIGVFAALVIGRYGTPFVVAHRLLAGGLVFLAGRTVLVGLHELAHGLAMESVGRRVQRAGLKLVFIFPYAFVDTSEVYFEPRRRRQLVTVAGPLSDFAVAGTFAIICLVLPAGQIRDVCFQVAFAGYVAALFNLNPFIQRDGYHLVSDRLGVPGLRARARVALRQRLSGAARGSVDPVLVRYGWFGLLWSVAAVGVAVAMSLRFQPVLEHYADPTVVWIVFVTLWAALLAPVCLVLAPPLAARVSGRPMEAGA